MLNTCNAIMIHEKHISEQACFISIICMILYSLRVLQRKTANIILNYFLNYQINICIGFFLNRDNRGKNFSIRSNVIYMTATDIVCKFVC